jgi:hypothetical protein
MTDKFGHIINVGDSVFCGDFYNQMPRKALAVIEEIRPTEIKIKFENVNYGWFWVGNWKIEYASVEKMFLWKLEN